MSLLPTNLQKICKSFHKKYSEHIEDIVLFGSIVRGKLRPNDVDLLLIFSSKIDKEIEYVFRKNVEEFFPTFEVSVTSKTSNTWKEETFSARDSIFFEGISLLRNCTLASDMGYTAFGMFIYTIKKFTNTERTRFYYALNGRDTKGMLDELEGLRFSHNQILVPIKTIELTKEFFKSWHVEFNFVPLLLPSRLASNQVLNNSKSPR